GAGGTAAWTLDETGWGRAADRGNFLVVIPEGTPPDPTSVPTFLSNPQPWDDVSTRWDRGTADVAFINTLLADLAGPFAIDPRRLYATGFSNGAGFAFRLGVEMCHRLAAIAPVAGHCWLAAPRPDRPLPTLYMIGASDPLVPAAGGEVKSPWGGVV